MQNVIVVPDSSDTVFIDSHKTRLHIGVLVKDTSARLKEASDTDHHSGISVS